MRKEKERIMKGGEYVALERQGNFKDRFIVSMVFLLGITIGLGQSHKVRPLPTASMRT